MFFADNIALLIDPFFDNPEIFGSEDLVKGFFLFLTRQTIIIVSRLIEYDLKNEIFDQYQVLSLSFYKRNKTGDLMNRISDDVSKVRMYIGPAIMYTANLTLLFILVIYTMLKVNTELTLYVLLPLPLLSFLIYYVSNIITSVVSFTNYVSKSF